MVPPAYRATCAVQGPNCEGQVDTRAVHTFRFVSGWAENRQAGGTNAIALREEHDRWACRSCINDLRKGIDPGQTTLWTAPRGT